jgi:hypothetical protein
VGEWVEGGVDGRGASQSSIGKREFVEACYWLKIKY